MSLIERSVSDETLTGRVLSRHLEWPMEFSENAAAFEEFGTKGGDLPGIVTEASFIQVSGADPYAIVLFLHGLTHSETSPTVRRRTHTRRSCANSSKTRDSCRRRVRRSGLRPASRCGCIAQQLIEPRPAQREAVESLG